MAVYDYSYKVYDGPRRGALWRWLAIPYFAYLEIVKKRIFTGLLTVAALHLLGCLTIIYLYVNAPVLAMLGIPMRALPPIDGQFFKYFIDMEFPLCFVLAFSLGADLIARDMRQHALVLYAAKPINRWEYFLGKFSVLFLLFFLLLCILPLLVFGVQTLVSPAESPWALYFWRDYAWIGPAIALYGTVCAVTLSLLMMTASSLTRNARYAGILFAVFVIGSSTVAGMIAQLLNSPDLMALAPLHSGAILGAYLFRMVPDDAPLIMSRWAAWGSILGYWTVCGLILWRQIRYGARYGR